jgi:hypothetical protein
MSREFVEVELDRPRKLRFTMGNLRVLQQRLNGGSLLHIANRIEAIDLEAIVQAYWVGLTWEEKKLTVDKVQDILQAKIADGTRMGDLIRPLTEALIEGAGLQRSDSDNDEPPGNPQTGA